MSNIRLHDKSFRPFIDYDKIESAIDEVAAKITADYKDSKDMALESRYRKGLNLIEKGKYDDAMTVFDQIGDYKESKSMVSESKYKKGLALLEKKQYDDATDIFELLGDYKDSSDMAHEAQYQKGLALIEDENYYEAMTIFEQLGNYKESNEKYRYSYYYYGLSLLYDNDYETAITVFETLGKYKKSKSNLLQAKYGYVKKHLDYDNMTTFEYLKELKSANYKDSKKLYNNLYAWKITNAYFNCDSNDTTSYQSLSKYDPVYCHFTVEGGPPNGSTYVYCVTKYPDGQLSDKNKSNSPATNGSRFSWGWSNGIYPYYPEWSETGTLVMTFYDSSNNNIGKATITIPE